MAKETVLIGCRLPQGLTLQLRSPKGEVIGTSKVNGMNSSKIKGATYTTTAIDAEFWTAWKKVYSDYPAFKNGALFEANTEQQAEYKGIKEYGSVKTGFEPMKQDEAGVKPASKE